MYCGECYQCIQLQDLPDGGKVCVLRFAYIYLLLDFEGSLCCMLISFLSIATSFSCDWPEHLRSTVVFDTTLAYRCCEIPDQNRCNWVVCIDCCEKVSYGLRASYQINGIQVQ
jgi:hypothetical protein